jgi:hypothetical protein
MIWKYSGDLMCREELLFTKDKYRRNVFRLAVIEGNTCGLEHIWNLALDLGEDVLRLLLCEIDEYDGNTVLHLAMNTRNDEVLLKLLHFAQSSQLLGAKNKNLKWWLLKKNINGETILGIYRLHSNYSNKFEVIRNWINAHQDLLLDDVQCVDEVNTLKIELDDFLWNDTTSLHMERHKREQEKEMSKRSETESETSESDETSA